MKQKATINQLEPLQSFKARIMADSEMHKINGGTVDCDTATPDGMLHCDHIDTGTGDFGPDLTVDPISYKI
jgi:hypothetical protein